MHFGIANMIRTFEAMTPDVPWLPAGNALADEMFYDTSLLLPDERVVAYASRATEGSIMIVRPDGGGLEIFECADPRLTGTRRACNVVDQLDAWLAAHPAIAIDTVVIPGCGSSPVGAAALGKTVARILTRPVLAIVSGQGRLDAMFEIWSGGMLMGPTGRLFSSVHLMLHFLAGAQPFASWAAAEAAEFVEAIQESATLKVLIDRRLLTTAPHGGRSVRAAGARGLNTIVSHSKANWAVLATLLDFELETLPQLTLPATPLGRSIDVVTFGCWVDLPDRFAEMGRLFHYHQLYGSADILALLNQAPQASMRLGVAGRIDLLQEVDPTRSPDEMIVAGRGHNLVQGNMIHIPIEDLLPAIVNSPQTGWPPSLSEQVINPAETKVRELRG